MRKNEAVAEVFITAFKSLPRKEKEHIVKKLLDEIEIELFSSKEWETLGKLAQETGSIYADGNQAKQHLAKL
ncbi:MAG: hypothetical protein HZA78_13035 [Candidatus Schekmanbacteria bacterium]|nr:hypothetical protein [Candidatus Schekmanbacteria bacterium]